MSFDFIIMTTLSHDTGLREIVTERFVPFVLCLISDRTRISFWKYVSRSRYELEF